MNSDHYEIARLIEGHLSKKLSVEEEQHFLHLLATDPHIQELTKTYQGPKELIGRLKYMDFLDSEAALKNVKARANLRKTRTANTRSYLKYAASILLIGASVLWAWQTILKNKGTTASHSTNNTSNEHVYGTNKPDLILSSGQKIILQNGSSQLKEVDGTILSAKINQLSYPSSGTKTPSDQQLYNTLNVPTASMYRIKLSDGTMVWVNNSSQLSFPVSFHGKDRVVSLKGEAYFEVAKDPSRPFKIKVNGTEINVLGTKFNIKAFDEQVSTTLVEGSVKIGAYNKSRLLQPGQQAITAENDIHVQKADIEKAIAWKKGYFNFNEEDIQSIMEQLSRWYDVKIHYTGNIPPLHYSGNISRNEKLENVLVLLQDITDLKFELKGKILKVEY